MRFLAALAAGMLIYIAGASPFSSFLHVLAITGLLQVERLPDEPAIFYLFIFRVDPTLGLSILNFQMASFACLAGCAVAMLVRRWAYLVAMLLLVAIFLVPYWYYLPIDMDILANMDWYRAHVAPWWPYAIWRGNLFGGLMVAGTCLGIYLTCRLRAVPATPVAQSAPQPVVAG
ncbi:MAG: hypothetical protein IPK59_17060 [Rhodospirillaceae bacterium]|nr:hypothetical protein [Rhodospirillaceae bacterium]